MKVLFATTNLAKVRKYKEDYPGVTKTFAEKACIKTILDQRKLEQSRMAKSSTI